MSLMRPMLAAVRALLVLTVILGVMYPLSMTAIARALPGRTDGSLITRHGQYVGSALLGQAAADPRWFQARPSAVDHRGDTSGGSNLGPNAVEQARAVAQRRAELLRANPQANGPIPPDALTASGSGLDPHISPAYAHGQAARIAAANRLSPQTLEDLIAQHTEQPLLGFIGQARVNVTELNAALAAIRAG